MMKLKIRVYIFALLAPLLTLHAIDEKETEAIGTEVYIYGYPLVMLEITRRVMTNTVKPEGQKSPYEPIYQFQNFSRRLL